MRTCQNTPPKSFSERINRKKKKSKVKSDSPSKIQISDDVKDLLSVAEGSDSLKSPSTSSRNSPALPGSGSSSRKTEAERRFEEVQRRRVCSYYKSGSLYCSKSAFRVARATCSEACQQDA